MKVRVQSEPFDTGAELAGFGTGGGQGGGQGADLGAKPGSDVGAVVSFTGVVRGTGGLARMVIEHYPGMTERAIAAFAEEARDRWELADVLVIHRFGSLKPGEPIMMVATASRHRTAAFEAAEFLMDWLKSRAPFWKKEIGTDGEAWVAAKDEDETALDRW
jgi:molybdopterin synthase catalytic subunit